MKQNVCIQGLGFVGSATAVAVSINPHNKYTVFGVDLKNNQGSERVNSINNGKFPFNAAK